MLGEVGRRAALRLRPAGDAAQRLGGQGARPIDGGQGVQPGEQRGTLTRFAVLEAFGA